MIVPPPPDAASRQHTLLDRGVVIVQQAIGKRLHLSLVANLPFQPGVVNAAIADREPRSSCASLRCLCFLCSLHKFFTGIHLAGCRRPDGTLPCDAYAPPQPRSLVRVAAQSAQFPHPS